MEIVASQILGHLMVSKHPLYLLSVCKCSCPAAWRDTHIVEL